MRLNFISGSFVGLLGAAGQWLRWRLRVTDRKVGCSGPNTRPLSKALRRAALPRGNLCAKRVTSQPGPRHPLIIIIYFLSKPLRKRNVMHCTRAITHLIYVQVSNLIFGASTDESKGVSKPAMRPPMPIMISAALECLWTLWYFLHLLQKYQGLGLDLGHWRILPWIMNSERWHCWCRCLGNAQPWNWGGRSYLKHRG